MTGQLRVGWRLNFVMVMSLQPGRYRLASDLLYRFVHIREILSLNKIVKYILLGFDIYYMTIF